MRGVIAGLLGLGLNLAGCAAPTAVSGVAVSDLMTVSGRQALPTAAHGSRLAGQLGVSEIVVAEDAATTLRLDSATLRPGLREAFNRSLANHGYLASDEPLVVGLSVTVGSPTLTVDETGTTATVELTVRAPDGHPASSCLNQTTSGRFRGLAPINSGAGERTTAVVATVLMGLAGAPPGLFMTDQFRNADAENAALNSGRAVLEGEAVTPRGQPAAQFAGMHALRVAIATYVVRLGSDPACLPEAGAAISGHDVAST